MGAALVGLAVAGLLAACGGHAKADSPGTAPSGGGIQAYADCLRQHGVTIDIPTARPSGRPSARPSGVRPSGVRPSDRAGFPGFGGGAVPSGVDPSTWASAQQACASLRPSFGGNGGRGANNGAITAYRNCLRDHGVTASTGPDALNTADPKVAAAVQACAPLRPSARPS